ncbi:MAG TPA: deoxyribonuclease IV, partial [Trebonia sp.]|nr:deoxyribonuclease IV [Trebonia sp.]
VGAEVIQVFVSNPRGWAAGPGDAGQDARLRESEIPVFVHATYMINLGSGNPEVAAKSANAVAHALRRGGEIGARGVVVHTGSAAGWAAAGADEGDGRERALRQIGEITLPLLDKLGDDDPDLLFEPMAGQGQMLCARAGDLATYLSAVEHHPKAGVCLDTCHMFAAGHDLTAEGGVAAMLGELGTVTGSAAAGTGVGRVKLVHANDSVLGYGSKRDRHETIGAGIIGAGKNGTGPFRDLLAALPGVPFVVETPGGKAGHARDIATLKELRAAS